MTALHGLRMHETRAKMAEIKPEMDEHRRRSNADQPWSIRAGDWLARWFHRREAAEQAVRADYYRAGRRHGLIEAQEAVAALTQQGRDA